MSQPTVVCICGSTRFSAALQEAIRTETLAGRIVLAIGCDLRDTTTFGYLSPADLADVKRRLNELHLRKIDLADEVLILNVGGYVGDSTHRELEYACRTGKRIRWLEDPSCKPLKEVK